MIRISPSLRERKRMHVNLSVKSIDAEGRFAGYASVFDVLDNQRDVMQRGAFTKTLQARGAQVKLLWQHMQDEPIGVITQMFEDERGLYVEGRLLLEVARAREALALLKSGAISGLSIGYSPRRYTLDPESGVRNLHEVELWEVSLVTFPANEAAGVTVVKALTPPLSQKEREQIGAHEAIALCDALDRARGILLR